MDWPRTRTPIPKHPALISLYGTGSLKGAKGTLERYYGTADTKFNCWQQLGSSYR